MKCHRCQEDVLPTEKTCPKCGEKIQNQWIRLFHAIGRRAVCVSIIVYKMFKSLFKTGVFYAKKAWPHLKRFFSIKRNVYITTGVLASLVLLIVLLGVFGKPNPPSMMKLGPKTVLLEQNIPSTGGTLTILDQQSPIQGLTIHVPSGAYDTSLSFSVATQPINSHEFGEAFTPITPLIHIDNGHQFSKTPMTVTIPIELKEDEFAMGFYVNLASNTLEGIPMKNLTGTEITLLTQHFSSIVVSKISIEELIKLTHVTNPYIDTGFVPGVDDWQFTNYGSYLAPGGHCAGQVLTMAWYYHTQKQEKGEPALFNRFDNVGYAQTESFMEDDQLGYRFSSVIQHALDFESETFFDYLFFAGDNKQLIYFAFSYAMFITKNPQLMAIYATDNHGNILSGHAILAYKMQGYDLYVADPNYPGQTNRYVHFNTSPNTYDFDPYSSGANAKAILNDGALLYNEIFYIGESALVNYETIESAYDQVLDGTIGNDVFPTLESVYLSKYDNATLDHVWQTFNGISINLGTDHNENMPCHLQNKAIIAVTANHADAVYTLYQQDQKMDGPFYGAEDGYMYYEVDLVNGKNEIGILAEIVIDGQLYYADFIRITIDYQAGVTVPCQGSIIGQYVFYSRSDQQQLVSNHTIVIREDGTFTESYTVIQSSYTNVIHGTWRLEPGEKAGDNILYLTLGSTTDTYLVLENFLWLKYIADDVVFLFRKSN